MNRRRAIAFAALAAAGGAPLLAGAQQRDVMVRLALLLPADNLPTDSPFVRELRTLGYEEGRNLAIERRSAHGNFALLPALAAELAALRPDVLVAFLTQASIAAKRAAGSLRIVIVAVGDPVGAGLVASLAHPGGNVTGTAAPAGAIVGKQLELIRELKPSAKRVAALWNPANAVFQAQAVEGARLAAQRLGLRLDLVEARTGDDVGPRIAAVASSHPDALLVLGDPLFVTHVRRIGEAIASHRLLAVGGSRAYAEHAMLATYTPDLADSARQAARVVDRILRGARPADIPVEVVSKFELVFNLRTAQLLGVSVMPTLLARADEIIR